MALHPYLPSATPFMSMGVALDCENGLIEEENELEMDSEKWLKGVH